MDICLLHLNFLSGKLLLFQPLYLVLETRMTLKTHTHTHTTFNLILEYSW